MTFDKWGGNITRVNLTAKEQKALDKEIMRQFHEQSEELTLQFDAMLLIMLHEEYGFGEKRLKDFARKFAKYHKELAKNYEAGQTDCGKISIYKLKQIGIDIVELEKELESE